MSTLCASAEKNEKKKIDKDEILAALRAWQESGNLPEDVEIVSHVVSACNEVKECATNPFDMLLKVSIFFLLKIPALKEKLREKERQLAEVSSNSVMNGTLHQAVAEAKRQYDAIDAALEVRDANYISLI